jgi:lipoprotein-releasing system ATP-binding protein
MSRAIEARGLTKTYLDGERRVPVLRGVDLDVEAGEMVAIVGPSGSGKSTLLHILGALDRPDGGSVRIGGTDWLGLSRTAVAAFRNRHLGFVFQSHQLLPDFTALENVLLPGRIAGRPPRVLAARAEELLGSVGLAERLDHFPSQLSGGECQRVSLCRALVLEPAVLLADEPTGNLDPESGETVFRLLFELTRRVGSSVVLVTHNPGLAGRCAKLFGLEQGVLRALSASEPAPPEPLTEGLPA